MTNINLIGNTLAADSESLLVPGAGISITEAPAGTFTIDNTGGGLGPSLLTNSLAAPAAIVSGVLTTVASVTGLIPGDIYLFIGQVEWANFTNNSTAVCVLFINASAIAAITIPFVPAGAPSLSQNLSVCGTVGFGIDIVSLQVFQDNGVNVTVNSAGATFLQALHV